MSKVLKVTSLIIAVLLTTIPNVLAQRPAGAPPVFTVSTAALGTVRGILGQATVNYQGTITSGNAVGARGAIVIASGATAGSGAFLYGTQGKVTVSSGGAINGADVSGLVGQLDLSNGGNTSGQVSAVWADLGATASGSMTQTYLIRATNTTNATIQDAIHIYAKATNAFSLENNGSAMIDATSHGSTAAGRIAISVNGAQRYLHVFSD